MRGHEASVTALVFSPDGTTIATGDAVIIATVRLWDAATGQQLHTLRGHSSRVWSVAFSVDSQRVFSASEDKTLKVWSAATGEELLTLRGHEEGLSCVAVSPDGRTVGSASYDGTVKIWKTDNVAPAR